jgi:hypothetical protein
MFGFSGLQGFALPMVSSSKFGSAVSNKHVPPASQVPLRSILAAPPLFLIDYRSNRLPAELRVFVKVFTFFFSHNGFSLIAEI